ncbi:hypothetical protein VTN96DRAFT_1477 [Rasamsonia emersonii]|uniref:Uncharacterized protein n=1 Tax=Rasamsonia emersonii (strain ATCC 16479 / CBS 393.64 / IMI 116815) TaxID=1408163 RepID=A0A0F4Z3H1_RASE3|nr:hypothetical protein T310_0932 [Rasamsonia emersonii CBS 393.64]KKA25067.1 hypothetical protein T310_0932 [Rasamsonia emersonii CBS 393.64]
MVLVFCWPSRRSRGRAERCWLIWLVGGERVWSRRWLDQQEAEQDYGHAAALVPLAVIRARGNRPASQITPSRGAARHAHWLLGGGYAAGSKFCTAARQSPLAFLADPHRAALEAAQAGRPAGIMDMEAPGTGNGREGAPEEGRSQPIPSFPDGRLWLGIRGGVAPAPERSSGRRGPAPYENGERAENAYGSPVY